MDRFIWLEIRKATRSFSGLEVRPKKRCAFPDSLIVRMFLWAVWHDRPKCWACHRYNYNGLFRPRRLPSYSQFCRRVASPRFQKLLRIVNQRLLDSGVAPRLYFLDGKALPVSECSKDPDARVGRGAGKFSRGYKLHALTDGCDRVVDYRVRPLNVNEKLVGKELIPSVPPKSIVLADGNYDSGALYLGAEQRGARLFTHLKGWARSAYRLRRMARTRLQAMSLWLHHPDLAESIYAKRGAVERTFAHASSFGGGLGPLPAWVRRLPTVTAWVTAKLIVYHARIRVRSA